MMAGILLGPQFAGLIKPDLLGDGLTVLVSLAVALILFEGGLSLDPEAFAEVNTSLKQMLSVGLLITIIGSALCAHYLLHLSWTLSFLFGAFMSITGLTVINPILSRVKVKRELATILRGEGILSNAIGAFISVGVLEIILVNYEMMESAGTRTIPWSELAYGYLIKLVIGISIGFTMGWFMGRLLKTRYVNADLKNLVVLAWVFACFALSNTVEKNTGILAVVMCGFAVRRENIPQLGTLKRFKGQLSILFISILFIIISANLNFENIMTLGMEAIYAVLAIVFLVRPIAIFISNIGILSIKDKLFLSWIGPKGIVSASVASLFYDYTHQ